MKHYFYALCIMHDINSIYEGKLNKMIVKEDTYNEVQIIKCRVHKTKCKEQLPTILFIS